MPVTCKHAEVDYITGCGEAACVGRLWVDPKHRGKGIGTEVMKRIIQEARDAGDRRVKLDAVPLDMDVPYSRLTKFYKRLGFVKVGTNLEGWDTMSLDLKKKVRVVTGHVR